MEDKFIIERVLMVGILKNNRGTALVVAVFMSSILLTMIGAGLLFSGLGLKTTSSFRVGTNAIQVADAGIQHALVAIPSGTDFTYGSGATVLSTTPFPTALSGYSYEVTATNNSPGSPSTATAILTSTAIGPNSGRKIVVAYIGRGSYGLGAVALPGSTAAFTETNFSGTSFSINGNDNCSAAPAVPGIAVTDAALATEIANDTTSDGGLASNQMSLVSGAGGSPSVVSIQPLSQTVSQLADAYLAHSHVDLAGGNYSSTGNWGTSATPQITRINGDAQIQGTIEGYGVLIVDGTLGVAGSFTFHGLVIARGDVQVQVTGNAGIYGSLLIDNSTTADAGYELDVRGNAAIRYDSCALAAANGWVPLPKAPRLLAWQEKFV